MKLRICVLTLFLVSLNLIAVPQLVASEPKIKIVTTTTTLASLVETLAGDWAQVEAIASPRRDLHQFVPTPKDVFITKKADVLIHHGLQAEPWLPPLLHAAANRQLLEGTGYLIDVSAGIEALEMPASVSRLEGDIHPMGNPHYWLDPENAKHMAQNLATELARLYPEKSASLRQRLESWEARLDAAFQDWTARLQPFAGSALVTYHRSWSYFAQRFKFRVIGEVEPKPGIPPTGQHMAGLIEAMRHEHARVIIREPYLEKRTPEKIAQAAKAQVIELLQFVDLGRGLNDYIALMTYNVTTLEKALKSEETP
jgi:ABC-type Zn uptake system ZnuABC Zn-binding protein ZnuA